MKRHCSTSLVLVVMACMAWLAPTAATAEESTDEGRVKWIIEYFRAKNQVSASMSLQIKEPLQPSGKIAGAKSGVLSAGTNQVSFIVSNDGRYVVFGSEVKEFQPSVIKGAKTGSLNTGRQTTQVTISDDSTYAIVGEVEDLTVDPFASVMKKISLKDVASKGPANAKVTIVEYSDYQCPYCSKGYQVMEDQVLKEYGNKVRFIYKDFPL